MTPDSDHIRIRVAHDVNEFRAGKQPLEIKREFGVFGGFFDHTPPSRERLTGQADIRGAHV